jgi:hypothetical protein
MGRRQAGQWTVDRMQRKENSARCVGEKIGIE